MMAYVARLKDSSFYILPLQVKLKQFRRKFAQTFLRKSSNITCHQIESILSHNSTFNAHQCATTTTANIPYNNEQLCYFYFLYGLLSLTAHPQKFAQHFSQLMEFSNSLLIDNVKNFIASLHLTHPLWLFAFYVHLGVVCCCFFLASMPK